MDLISADPFWAVRNGLPVTFPSLSRDERCDVAIIGAGVTGALIADALSREGMSVVVLDKREAAHGSTSGSTGLLQYEVDVMLVDLIARHGEQHAVRAYRLGLEALDRLESLAGEFENCGFRRRSSCYLASRKKDVSPLQEEYEVRQQYGFDVRLLSEQEIGERFRFTAPAALWSTQAAVIDPYRFTYQLLVRSHRAGARIFDRTEVTDFEHTDAGWRLTTDRGPVVHAQKLVIATGYEAQLQLKRKVTGLHSTYAAISQPLDSHPGWFEECLLWESARPYFYARTTEDGRALVGGFDEKFRNPMARDALIPRKSKLLAKRFSELFPEIPFEVEYAWAGTFAETKDGLAYIGCVEEWPETFFALGYGGNGITWSVIAADILRDFCLGRANDDSQIFRFDRS